MTSDAPRSDADRVQTDESLRVERQNADDAIGPGATVIEDTADAVIAKARGRADEVLAKARGKTDRQLPTGLGGVEPRRLLEHERSKEDDTLREERVAADIVLEDERAELAALLEREREETDKHLSTERARADAAVSTRDEFLGIVSHDLRNMLSAVLGFGSLIANAELTEDHRDRVIGFAERIQRSGLRMNRLIGDLVDLASIEAGALAVSHEVGDPGLLVSEAVDTFLAEAARRDLSLVTAIAPNVPFATFDSARLLQVMVNLITNALKFTPSGGTVTVRLDLVDGEVRFAVSDTGVGIPEDQLATVFERYRQVVPNDRRGVGLGLYISKCIVLGHDGKIWVESQLAKGSTFYFTIPVAPAVE